MGTEYSVYTDTATTDFGTDTAAPQSLGGNEFQAATGFEVPGDVLSTAKNPSGSAVVNRQLQETDTVSCHGQRMTIGQAMSLGFVTKDIAGMYAVTPTGAAGAKIESAPKGKLELASGGTAEDAAAEGFLGTPEAEEALGTIIEYTNPDTQIAALHSYLRNDGEVEQTIIDRMASQAGVEPYMMAETIEAAKEGMATAVMQKLAPLGVYDEDAFAAYLHGDSKTHQRLIDSTHDLMMSNSTKGFEALAADFVMSADKIDPATVADALTASGISFSAMNTGGYLLDLTAQGYGQMTFKQAVQLGYIKLSRN